MNYTNNIEELIYLRKKARESKNWKAADEIRDYLDSQNVFIFDHPDNIQEVFHLPESYFNHIYFYNTDGIEWSETRVQKIERFHSIKFKSKRHFIEWNIRRERLAESRFEAWLYSTLRSY